MWCLESRIYLYVSCLRVTDLILSFEQLFIVAERHGVMSSITAALESVHYTTASVELPDMRHFLYKSCTSAQFTSVPCYNIPEARRRLGAIYLAIQNWFLSDSQPLKLVRHCSRHEMVLAWLTQSFPFFHY